MRIRVDLPIDKPLWRKGKIANMEGEKYWVNFKYERLPTLCFLCGRMGHDDKHCSENPDWQNTSRQYGDWMRAFNSPKISSDKAKGATSGGREVRSEEHDRENSQTISKSITNPVTEWGCQNTNQGGNDKIENLEIMGGTSMSVDVGNKGEIIPEFSLEMTQFDFTKRGGRDEAWTKSLSWDKSCRLRYIQCS